MSKKLRAAIVFSRMNFIAVETPAARVPLTGEPPKFLDASVRIVAARQCLQIISNQLIQALSDRLRFLAGTSQDLLVYRKSYIHSLHSLCVHMYCVKTFRFAQTQFDCAPSPLDFGNRISNTNNPAPITMALSARLNTGHW